ncbi:hypothetical protein [Salinicoccus roseus]|uniref:hypothetical protein n=1 Tax=Salinicoccus roseus TaxID=45670 RepID=UPI0023005A46|nr:hypothetical protein [Salinicoccus roseus]
MNKKDEYLVLLSKTYNEAIEFLLKKYGVAEDDYYREKSYERFLNGEIKKISKGKFARSLEGLECHHIAENKFLNMTNESYISAQNIPFRYHQKEKLVFCDVVEHTILHTLIAKETSLKLGSPGYITFLRPKIEDWYVKKIIPRKSKWHIACYHRAYITPEEAFDLLERMDSILSVEQKQIDQEALEKKKIIIRKGNFKNLNSDSSRYEIVSALYDLNKMGASGYLHVFNNFVYSEEYKKRINQPLEFEDFAKEMEKYDLDGMLRNIQSYIEYVEGMIDREEYHSRCYLYSKTINEVEVELRAQEEKEKHEKLKNETFHSTYPKFENTSIKYDVNRQEVNALLFKYSDKDTSFIQFQSEMKSYSMDELLQKLHLVLRK